MCRHVDIVLTDVSEENIASIFKVEEKRKSASEEPARAGADNRSRWFLALGFL
jgi:hypothetical protein